MEVEHLDDAEELGQVYAAVFVDVGVWPGLREAEDGGGEE